MSIPTKAATAAFQFVKADIAWAKAKKAFREAPDCTEADDGIVSTDSRIHDPNAFVSECWRLGDPDGCDACKVRLPLANAMKEAAKVRKLARLRAIRAVKGVL